MMLTEKSIEFSRLLKEKSVMGPYLLHQEKECNWRNFHWKSHLLGFVVDLMEGKERVLLLNGIFLCKGKWNNWWPCGDGVATQEKNKIFYHDENRKELLYKGDCSCIWFHPEGFIIPLEDNRYLVNGQREIKWESLNYCDGWSFHPGGGYVERQGRDLINRERHRFLRNGKKVVYEGIWDSWWPLLFGIGIRIGNWFFSVFDNQKNSIFQGEYDEWRSSPYGVIVRRGGQFTLYCA